MSNEEKSKKVNPYDLSSVRKVQPNPVRRPDPKEVNPYSLSGRNSARGGSKKSY